MSVFNTHYTPRFSVLRVAGVAVVLIAAGLFASPRLPFQRATISDALPQAAAPTETVFPSLEPFSYEGYVAAVLVSGEGLRIRTPQAEGGYVDVYTTDGLSASVSEGSVRVQGYLRGISCSYGMCVPYGDLTLIEPLAPELE